MPIKDFDGSEFKLEGYNPIMSSQTRWTEDGILHNMDYEEHKYNPYRTVLYERPKRINPETVAKSVEKFVPPVEISPEPNPIEQQKEIVKEINQMQKPSIKYEDPSRILCHVLPVLPGKQITYGNHFTAEVARTGGFGDLISRFWTNAFPSLERGSIVFIAADLRWWKVQKCTPSNGGIIIECTVSDITPSFK